MPPKKSVTFNPMFQMPEKPKLNRKDIIIKVVIALAIIGICFLLGVLFDIN